MNKVGPNNNPQETYNYYSLPFCHPSGHSAHKWGGLGEVLGGNELIDSQIEIKFQSTPTSFHVGRLNLGLVVIMDELLQLLNFSFLQKMWRGPLFVNWSLMNQRSSSLRMQLRMATGLSSLWVCSTQVSCIKNLELGAQIE